MDLRDYERAKFELAEFLRSVALLTKGQGRDSKERLQELFARLAEDRFNLVVVGRFSRGKTSLMNAILGTDRLPVGIVPLTSVITTIGYGSTEKVIIHYQERRLPSDVPLEALPDYITQRHNPGNLRRVKTAEVQLPAEILRRGFYFIDTPGLGSPIPENTRTTEAFLPEADAFVLVTSYESPLSEEELRVLHAASSSARRVFVVLNKQDTVSDADRSEAMSYVREQLRERLGDHAPQVFSVSAQEGLAAKRAHDEARLEASGIAALETELVRFLLADKSVEFLLRLHDRAAELLGDLPETVKTTRLTQALRDLSARIAADRPSITVRAQTPSARSIVGVGPYELRRCAICEHVLHASFEFLRRYQYDLSFDFQVRQRHARRGGLCAPHTWRYEVLASPHGICTGYPPLFERLSRQLRAAIAGSPPAQGSVASRIEALLPTEATCPLCAVCAEAEADAVASLAAALAKEPAAGQLCPVVCLPHLSLLVAAIDDPEIVRAIIEREALALERVAEDMHRFAVKHDALRRALASDEETSASEVGLAVLVGARHVNSIRLPNQGRPFLGAHLTTIPSPETLPKPG